LLFVFEPGSAAKLSRNAPEIASDSALLRSLVNEAERFSSVDSMDMDRLVERIGASRIVLIGEASHGTSEFYRMRARITRALIENHAFSFVAIEGDWPDAARIDHYVRHVKAPAAEWMAFARFPMWMWRNREVAEFVDWLRVHNEGVAPAAMTSVHGLDLYSLYTSMLVVLDYLDSVDPPAAAAARRRYGCLTPWQEDPAVYGRAAVTGEHPSCAPAVIAILTELLKKRSVYTEAGRHRFLDAEQNARLVASAELYYRTMYYGSRESWNLRDSHMFETLRNLLRFHGPQSKGIVWAHNSHVGDSAATDMAKRGEFNIGNLCRREFGPASYSIGFGTNSGTVAAASNWDEPMQVMTVRPALPASYESLCHRTGEPAFLLPLQRLSPELRGKLIEPRLERAIGVIYRPETERESHYFSAQLPLQFNEYLWFNTTTAVSPLLTRELPGLPDTYPFGT
jgi:protein-L-isoaspartate(D-aspartate) O-methyltransferase